MVSQLLLRLIDDIGTGLSEATIRGRLASIHEEAKAADAEFKRVKSDLKEAKSQVKELESKLGQNQGAVQSNRCDQTAEALLLLWFKHERVSMEMAADHLKIERGVAGYHADKLQQAGLIELGAFTPAGAMYVLTPSGRAYVVENKLSE